MNFESMRKVAIDALQSSNIIANINTELKNKAIYRMAELVREYCEDILEANRKDIESARETGISEKLIDRLVFDKNKIQSRVDSLYKISILPDPVGQIFHSQCMENGLIVNRMRVSIGVILMVYEARPHVTINGGALCLKSGNAVILRGGSEAKHCNTLLGNLWQIALEEAGLPQKAIQVIITSHEEVDELLQMDDCIDMVIPRGGEKFIKEVSKKSHIPVIKHSAGICHVYIDEGADVNQGIDIALDSKCLMPEVCNAMETLLISKTLIPDLPKIINAFLDCGVTVKGCEKTRSVFSNIEPATEKDWETEYLDTILSIKIVENIDEAINHINKYGSHHTDAIVTDSESRANKFIKKVNSAVVLVNASTMFCDGNSIGMGAEIGISTEKIHARGPMGLEELTSYKFVIHGEGHVMGVPELFKKLKQYEKN